ncbi:hypothetical protein ACHAWO_003148 [Cyclotella atomus]|uniref:PNPLA domain-containing protein n=1 Tax=Cyclotella atomus TaxID=382360 RepID=A0ABD3N0M1_9STRA
MKNAIPESLLLLLVALSLDFGASFQLVSSPYHVVTSRRQNQGEPKNRSHLSAVRPMKDDSTSSAGTSKARLIFPGGGLFFYWQAGVIAYLQENSYDLNNVLLSGASAGALSATIAKTSISPYRATELALQMSDEAGVWERPLGLMGIWGDIIYQWLNDLLPSDAQIVVNDERLHVLVTPVPSFGKNIVSRFESREDLIQANMASVHLPWFLNGNFAYNFRGSPCIDGSFLARPSDYFDKQYTQENQAKLILDFKRDPVMKSRAADFVKVVSKQAIWDILEQGKKHAKVMDVNREFDILR